MYMLAPNTSFKWRGQVEQDDRDLKRRIKQEAHVESSHCLKTNIVDVVATFYVYWLIQCWRITVFLCVRFLRSEDDVFKYYSRLWILLNVFSAIQYYARWLVGYSDTLYDHPWPIIMNHPLFGWSDVFTVERSVWTIASWWPPVYQVGDKVNSTAVGRSS